MTSLSHLEVKGVPGELGPTVEVASARIPIDRAPSGTTPSPPVLGALEVTCQRLDALAVRLFALCVAGTPTTMTLGTGTPLGIGDVRQLVLTGATVTAFALDIDLDFVAYRTTVTAQTHTWVDKVVAANGSVSGTLSVTYDDVAKKVV